MTLTAIRPNRDAIRAAANENQHYTLEDCPSHGKVRIRTVTDLPSMMGYGTDTIITFSCGCSNSTTPLTGC